MSQNCVHMYTCQTPLTIKREASTEQLTKMVRVVQYSDKFMHGMYCIDFRLNNTVQIFLDKSKTNKEQSNRIRNLTMPCINLSEYWTSTKLVVLVFKTCIKRTLISIVHVVEKEKRRLNGRMKLVKRRALRSQS